MAQPLDTNKVTEGIRVEVSSRYLPGESTPDEDHYVFAYDVRLANEGERQAKLVSRHWTVIDAEGKRHEVRGPGVVGETPVLDPGDLFKYTSFCPLNTRWGTMEGSYHMERNDGEPFDVEIGRFYLVADVPEPSRTV